MPGRLADKIAVITGSSSGIGRAIALAYASEGAHIVCSDLQEGPSPAYASDPTHQTSTVSEVQKLGSKALFQKCDTTSPSEVESLIATAVKEFGRLDIMVNNAGISVEGGRQHGPKPVWEFDEAAFDKSINVNVKGVFLGTKYATRQMVRQEPGPSGDRGWIVNLASVYGLRGSPNMSAYITSKHAVVGLTKSTALDCAPHRIHVNALCPGYTTTAFISALFQPEASEQRAAVEMRHPFKGLGNAQDIARAAVFLATEDAAWVTGVAMPVDGGYTCS